MLSIVEKAKKLLNSLPYQLIRDSPTIAYYTEWKLFDEYRLPDGIKVSGIEINGPFREEMIKDSDFILKFNDTKIHALHYASLMDVKKLVIEESGEYKITLSSKINEKVLESYHIITHVLEGVKAKIEIVERDESLSSMITVLEFILHKNSEIEVVSRSAPSNVSPSYSAKIFVLNGFAKVKYGGLLENGLMHREDFFIYLDGENSVANVNIAILGEGTSKVDYYFKGLLLGSNNKLKFLGLGLADDEAYVSIRAIGEVSRKSKEGSIVVESRTYNIGEKSKAIGAPLLSIRTDNIKEARHAVSISNISPEVIFYLESRGLTRNDVKKLLKEELKSIILS